MTSARLIVCLRKLTFAFLRLVCWCVLWLNDTAEVSEGTETCLLRRTCCCDAGATFTSVHRSWKHNAQRYRQTDGQTDDMMMPVADRTKRQVVLCACCQVCCTIGLLMLFTVVAVHTP